MARAPVKSKYTSSFLIIRMYYQRSQGIFCNTRNLSLSLPAPQTISSNSDCSREQRLSPTRNHPNTHRVNPEMTWDYRGPLRPMVFVADEALNLLFGASVPSPPEKGAATSFRQRGSLSSEVSTFPGSSPRNRHLTVGLRMCFPAH